MELEAEMFETEAKTSQNRGERSSTGSAAAGEPGERGSGKDKEFNKWEAKGTRNVIRGTLEIKSSFLSNNSNESRHVLH